jgi:hypothetical protein
VIQTEPIATASPLRNWLKPRAVQPPKRLRMPMWPMSRKGSRATGGPESRQPRRAVGLLVTSVHQKRDLRLRHLAGRLCVAFSPAFSHHPGNPKILLSASLGPTWRKLSDGYYPAAVLTTRLLARGRSNGSILRGSLALVTKTIGPWYRCIQCPAPQSRRHCKSIRKYGQYHRPIVRFILLWPNEPDV